MLTGDLDSSLANLASNLDFGNGAKKNLLQGGARGPPMTQGFAAFPGQQAQPAMAHPFLWGVRDFFLVQEEESGMWHEDNFPSLNFTCEEEKKN